jgi:uncharacterized membrane protein YjgN (DUF898 family)
LQIEPGSLPSEFPATQFEPQVAAAPSGPQSLDIRFTGSGSEYFRIWIVNLLLTVVTLSLYLPFAKARRLAYFQGNTLVGGHALGFHGDPWKMFRGYLLVLALGITYSVASRISPMAALVAVGALAAVWPALWRASLQFRTANTSWRGVRLRFTGSLNDAYNAMLPAFLPAVLITVLALSGGEAEELENIAAGNERMGMLIGFIMLVSVAAIPWLVARVKRYQHGHYAYATEQTQLNVGAGPFYGLWFKSMGVSLLTMLGAFVAAALLVVGVGGMALLQSIFSGSQGMGTGAGAAMGVVVVVCFGLIYLAMFAIPGPYVQSRFQNLLWGQTASPHLQFRSDLRLWPLGKRTVINLVLTVITLGLYRPFAAVAMAKLRLEAVSLDVDGNVDDWVNTQNARMDDATGDLAGDFFGIDLGL